MILIDLAAYAHDTEAHMEEMLTMNSYYHPREHDHADDAHFEHADHSGHSGHHPDTRYAHEQHHTGVSNYEQPGIDTGHEAGGVAGAAEQPAAEQWTSEPGSDQDLYQVLLAVERGELSAEDAARKLEELESVSSPQEGEGLI